MLEWFNLGILLFRLISNNGSIDKAWLKWKLIVLE